MTRNVKAKFSLELNTNIGSGLTIVDGGNVDFKVRSNGDDYNIWSDGNTDTVGIGTQYPTEKLTVEGNISASGDLIIGSLTAAGSGYISGSGGTLEISGSGLGLTVGGWSDGYHGNDEFIPILPMDWKFNDNSIDRGSVTTADSGSSAIVMNASNYQFAQKIIPKGFTATAVIVYGNTATKHACYSSSIDVGTSAQVGHATDVGTSNNITDVVGDGKTYVSVELNASNTSHEHFGGKITIERTT